MSDESIIRAAAAELDRIKAERLTDAQLRGNVDCYQYATNPGNIRWRDACMFELSARAGR